MPADSFRVHTRGVRRAAALLAFVLATAGCGDSDPTTELRELDPTLRLTAYRAERPDGDTLYLQVAETRGRWEGSFYFFDQEAGTTDVDSGVVDGDVSAEGELTLSLRNRFEPADPLVVLEGRVPFSRLELRDRSRPDDVIEFVEIDTGSRQDAGTSDVLAERRPTASAADDWGRRDPAFPNIIEITSPTRQQINWWTRGIPISIVPLVNPAKYQPHHYTATYDLGGFDDGSPMFLCTWGNGWTWIDLYGRLQLQARLWYDNSRYDIHIQDAPLSADSAILSRTGSWIAVQGTVKNLAGL